MKRNRRRLGWLGATMAIAIVVACWSPTEVRLLITTDLPCSGTTDGGSAASLRTGIYVGEAITSAEPEAETTACAQDPEKPGNRIGELAVVPSGDREGTATVHVVMRVDGSTEPDALKACRTGGAIPGYCIVARRTFKFLEHTSRKLDIRLDSRCLGVGCLETETCIDGQCVPSNVDGPGFIGPCTGPGCPDSGPPRDAAGDALDAPIDGGDPDATVSTCQGNGKGILAALNQPTPIFVSDGTRVFWPFSPGPNNVFGMRTNGASAPEVFATTSNVFAPYSGVATDGKTLWSAGPTWVERIEIATKTKLATTSNPTLEAVLAVSAGLNDIGWVSLRDGTELAGGSSLYKARGTIDSFVKEVNAKGGSRLAATKTVVWAANNALVFRNVIGSGAAPDEVSFSGIVAIGACDPNAPSCTLGDDLFVATGNPGATKLTRVSASGNAMALLDVSSATQIAVADDTVYFLTSAATFPGTAGVHYVKAGLASAAVERTLDPKMVFTEVTGLTVSDCVYFWARTAGEAAWHMHVLPKTP